MFVNLSKMVWSSRNHRSSIAVLVFVRQMKPERRDGIVVMVRGRVLQMHVCPRRSSGWDVCEYSEGCFENTERQRRLTTTCTITCTWRLRVMCLRTREFWWNTYTGRRLRSNVPNSSGWFFSVALYLCCIHQAPVFALICHHGILSSSSYIFFQWHSGI